MKDDFVCDGTCAGNEFGDCNHGDSNDGLHITESRRIEELESALAEVRRELAEATRRKKRLTPNNRERAGEWIDARIYTYGHFGGRSHNVESLAAALDAAEMRGEERMRERATK